MLTFRSSKRHTIFPFFAVLFIISASVSISSSAQTPSSGAKRPMTFLDMQKMRQPGSAAPSPDGRMILYTISSPDWKEAKQQTDIYLVSLPQGVGSTKQMTFTKDKNETSPRWSRSGEFFVFASNREAPAASPTQNQLYLMRPDGGEARRITDAKEGVSTFGFSRDGKWLAYRSGKSGDEQLYRLPVEQIDTAAAEQLTKQAAGVGAWEWAPDSRRIYFAGGERADADDKLRREKKFTVNIRNQETPLNGLWALDLEPRETRQLTHDSTITVADFSISDDGKWVGFRGVSSDRYKRNILEQNDSSDPFLLEVASGRIERLVTNSEVAESGVSFSRTAAGSRSRRRMTCSNTA